MTLATIRRPLAHHVSGVRPEFLFLLPQNARRRQGARITKILAIATQHQRRRGT